MRIFASSTAALLLATLPATVVGGVLPEDRADILYHRYEGGGVEIDGPSLLVRKSLGDSVSASASYYVDSVSSASIDVVTTGASPNGYSEERTQWGAGLDYLRADTTMSVSFSSSEENDYTADTINLGISQEVFGGLTTISLGYGSGSDDVSRRGSTTFSDTVDRNAYRLGVTQIITRDLILGFSYEAIADEGFLNNPYRQVRFVDDNDPRGYDTQAEIYPRTRASNSAAIRARYYLPYRAAVSGEYRFFTDDWGIDAHTVELGYVHPWGDRWTFEFKYRYYSQGKADFYSDLFPFADAQNFLARDKELSSFANHGPHLGATYTAFEIKGDRPVKGTVSAFYDRLMFSYDDFRDLRPDGLVPGTEPFYDFDADVIQLFLSVYF
jgi:Protein of unknown function (DUF3570)